MATHEEKNGCLLVSEATNYQGVFAASDNGTEITKIVIPIVQRDYAQGRVSPDVNRIRTRFLQVLYDALVNDKKTTLDFIYGNVDEKGELIPLDGQQRLTTLFLLHYYIAQHEKVDLEERVFLEKFTYKTRVSSRKFCEQLIRFTPDFEQDTLAEQIRDEAWFLMEWENDPTVQSMLVMLDDIHNKFRITEGLWRKLMGDNISFYFLPLSKMGVTDELYIKMNSRGKALTRFEHFKAELELKTKEVDQDLSKRIMRKIDREWTDILWPFRNSETDNAQANAITDDEFMRYIHFISDIIRFQHGEQELTDEFEIIDKQFSKDCPIAKENLLLLEQMFDIWKGFDIDVFFDSFISEDGYAIGKIWTDSPKNIFRECCKCYGVRIGNNRFAFSLVQTILLYAFTLFLRNNNNESVSELDFRRRLRIVNNLAKNSPDTVRSENMKILLSQVDNIILDGIVEKVEGKARFQTKQVEEEIAKLQWTTEHPDMAEMLFRLEDHSYLNGYISSIGLEHVEWCDRFYSLFSQDLDLVNCALLSIGDCFVKDAWRFQIGTADSRLANSVWSDILGPVKLEQNLCEALQTLLSRHEIFSEDVLQEEINAYLRTAEQMPVRYYIAKYQQMRPNRWGKYYWFNHQTKGRNSYHVLMMTTEISFGFNYDIFLKTLYALTGGKDAGLELGNYSYTEYNSKGEDRLYLRNQGLFLTLKDNTYKLFREVDDATEELESYHIRQNEQGIDTEDRIIVGLQLLKKYMKASL